MVGMPMGYLNLNGWLQESPTERKEHHYTHRLLTENLEHREHILSDLKQTVQHAHEDTKRHLRKLAGLSLDPFNVTDVSTNSSSNNFIGKDPTKGYPEKLDVTTLKGYFGETFAAIVAEYFPHFGMSGWKVPVYPFRFHKSAFYALEKWRQTGIEPGKIPGRHGDDMLAFRRDAAGNITHSIVCESKCTDSHRTDLIAEAHEQASSPNIRPFDIIFLADALEDYSDTNSKNWAQALRAFYFRDVRAENERCDLVSYICGKSPKRSTTWLSLDAPHPNYTAGRSLESVEIHLQDVDELIKEVYCANTE